MIAWDSRPEEFRFRAAGRTVIKDDRQWAADRVSRTNPPKGSRGIVRTGQKTPFRKATNAEVRARTQQVMTMLADGYRLTQIRRYMREKYDLKHRMANEYIAHARKQLREQVGIPLEDHVAQQFEGYCAILRNPEARIAEKLSAREAIRRMLGLDAPSKISATTPDGKESSPVSTINIATLPPELLQEIYVVLAKARGIAGPTAGNTVGSTVGRLDNFSANHDNVIDEPTSPQRDDGNETINDGR